MIPNPRLQKTVPSQSAVSKHVQIFARNLHDMGHMSDRDWKTYKNLFRNMVRFLKEPDIIIYLKASTDTLISRIKKRNRDFEKNINPEYLHQLNTSYNMWVKNEKKLNILTIETDDFNVFEDLDRLNDTYKIIEDSI